MPARARAKFPHVGVKKIGLQEMRFRYAFHGMLCVDAMEYVFPEDWPLVLRNFHRALKRGGHINLTVELPEGEDAEQAYQGGLAMGLPVLPGECGNEDGYHYHPAISQVRAWLREAHFSILEEAAGDAHQHFLLRRA
jgi:hypothetical protein